MIAIARRINRRVAARRGGWLLTEVLVSVGLLAMLLLGFNLMQRAAGKLNAIEVTRQRCIAAGQAQLESLQATGRPVAAKDFERLWPGLRADLSTAPGQGQWQGLTRVSVVASGKAQSHDVKVELARYYNRKVEVTP
jgi:Tfp pilus assembly protein PilV